MRHADLRRFGVIGPAGNMAVEWEFHQALPPDVTFNYARVGRPGWPKLTAESLKLMGQGVVQSAQDLVRTHPEVLLYACTSGSFVGQEGDADAHARMVTEETGIPAMTTASAVQRALRALSIHSVYLVTPYPDDINDSEVEFLLASGVGTRGVGSLITQPEMAIGEVDSDQIEALVIRQIDRIHEDKVDAIFISCTNLLTFDKIKRLEQTTGLPVITSNSAGLWGVLCAMGLSTDCVPGRLGKLTVVGQVGRSNQP